MDNTLAVAHDAAVQMIDTSIVRVHQHAACISPCFTSFVFRTRWVGDKLFSEVCRTAHK